MRGVELNYTHTLVTESCFVCGVIFGLPKDLQSKLLEERRGKNFYCPNGHAQVYIGKSKEQELREQLEQANSRLAARQVQLDASRAKRKTLERSNCAIQAHAKRVKTRVAAGVCPAGCKRHFTNLERHIATKHPAWKAETETPT